MSNTVTIVLDERGKAMSSMEFARKLEGWRDSGRREARFLIGSADGHDEAPARLPPTFCCRSVRRLGRI